MARASHGIGSQLLWPFSDYVLEGAEHILPTSI
jgi:hypothetical protein